MSLSPSTSDRSPEPAISDVCRNLETQFTQDLSKAEGMHVFARVRPMLNSEIEAGYKECIGTIDDETIRAIVPSSSVKFKSSSYQDITEDFKFTSAYGPEVGQFVFFQESMMNTMQNFIDGQNSLVFSYGITGSGKTFTFQGNIDNPGIIPLSLHLFFASIENQLLNRIIVKPDKFAEVNILNDNEIKEEYQVIDQLLSNSSQEEWSFRNTSKKSLAMVLCETFSDKFESDGLQTTLGPEEMAQAQAATVMKELSKKCAMQQNGYCSVWVSFAEIYNEYIYDLLQPNINQRTKLTLGEDKNGDVYVKGLREVCVFNSFDALKLLSIGQKNLKIASTKLNYQSSRSHCIFTVKVVRVPDPENIISAKVSRLTFCDLAGSERATKSQTTGLRLKEAGCINTSLLVLGRCLEQLRLNPSLRDKKRIPFRESKLTRLLSGFFTGRGKAVMITNASPSEVTFDETLHALRFSALATELIINDSYIATASNTLQTITNMWTNARNNVSVSSDKSISFEDSTVEALQEKDELIEKLLDLAESLTNNLEREKKEKAELEIKIRQEVCQEYSEYSDELLERQKKNYEEEQESIREIYKKRLSGMEKMYENIIKDLKSQMEESDSSCDESTADAYPGSMRKKRKSSVSKNSFNGDTKENTEIKEEEVSKNNYISETERFLNDIESLKRDLMSVSGELKRVKEELKKSKDYCLSLESATEEMVQKLEISNSNLEKALSENCELRIKIDYLQASHEDSIILKKEVNDNMNDTQEFENLKEQFGKIKLELENALKYNEDLKEKLDFVKIDCVSYKADNDDLFKKKTVLEERLKSLTEELAFTKPEKEDLYQKLAESEKNVIQYSNEASILLKKNNELIRQLDDAKVEYENSLEEFKKRTTDAEDALKSVNQTLDIALADSEELKEKFSLAFKELECTKSEKEDLYQKLMELEKRVQNSEEASILLKKNNELIKQLDKSKMEYEISLEEFKKRASDAEDVLKSVNETLGNALRVSEEQKEKLATLETEYAALRKTNIDSLKKKEELEAKYFVTIEDLRAEEKKTNCLSTELEKTVREMEKLKTELDFMKTECLQYEEKTFTLQETICNLEEKLEEKSSVLKELESEKAVYHEELNKMNCKLSESLFALEEEKKKAEKLLEKKNYYEKEYSDLHTSHLELLKNSALKDSVIGSETLDCKEELKTVNNKLEEALSALDKQKYETENLKSLSHSDKIEISLLQEQNRELNSLISIIDEQKQEIENLTKVILSDKEEIVELQKQNENLQDRFNTQTDYKKELDAMTCKLDEALCALDKQKKEAETLSNITHSDKKEIEELQNKIKELQDSLNLQIDYKKELDTVTSKLDETLCALDKQKKEAETLANVTHSDKKEIEELQNKIKELQDSLNLQIDYKKELDTVTSKLDETLCALDKQKKEAETLANVTHSDKKEIEELQNKIKELQDSLNLQIDYKKELDALTSKLDETLCALDKQKKEAETLANVTHSDKKEIGELQNKIKELQDSLNLQIDYKKELDTVTSKLDETLCALDKQKKEAETLANVTHSDKKKIEELQNKIKEMQDSLNLQIDYKKELDTVTSKLDETLCALDKQKKEAETLANVTHSDKKEIEELQNKIKELQDSLNLQIDYKKELDTVTSKLDETLCALDKEKKEAETLANVTHSDKKEIGELRNKIKELQDSLNLEIDSKTVLTQELDSMKNSLEEAFGTINGQKDELQNTLNECNSLKNKIADLMKIKDELQEKINSQEAQIDIMNDLMHMLQKCEKIASNKMDKVQSDFAKLKEENESLKELQRKNFDNCESELNSLRKMIQTLQYCEMQATKKAKELHTSSIKHVEQIMDLEKCIKERDSSIENLKNDYNLLQKQLKDFQVTSKKQLQTEKQLHLSEIHSIKCEKIIIEKENQTLKNQVTELETVKDALESKVKCMEKEFEKMDENKNEIAILEENLKNQSKKSLKTETEKITSDKKKASSTNKQSKTDTKKPSNFRVDKKSKQSSKDKKENESPEKKEEVRSEEKLPEKRSLRKTVRESEENTEEMEKKASKSVKNLGDKRKNKLKEKSETVTEGKKLKTLIYEEDQENINTQNITQKIRSSNRKQLRSVENENVSSGLDLIKNKALISPKSKGTKRKELDRSANDKLHEKKTLKKFKLQDMNEIENISNLKKPQNLRIQLLKADNVTNDIPLPSPRMTRGRKKLCILNAKENISQSKTSTRTVRS